jgi:hypothetical protein
MRFERMIAMDDANGKQKNGAAIAAGWKLGAELKKRRLAFWQA